MGLTLPLIATSLMWMNTQAGREESEKDIRRAECSQLKSYQTYQTNALHSNFTDDGQCVQMMDYTFDGGHEIRRTRDYSSSEDCEKHCIEEPKCSFGLDQLGLGMCYLQEYES